MQRAIRYSQQRIAAGSLLSQKQGYTHKLIVPNAVKLEAARAYIEWTAERIDAGEPDLATEGAVAKYMATEAGNKAAEDAIQAHGGNGYTKEYMVEKIKRDVRITTIYEGTSEILEWTIARDRWQHHLKTRGGLLQRVGGPHRRAPRRASRRAAPASAAIALRSLAVAARAVPARSAHAQPARALPARGNRRARRVRGHLRGAIGDVKPTTAVAFDPPLLQAMARVFAREAAVNAWPSTGCDGPSAPGRPTRRSAQSLNLAGAGASRPA